MSVNLREKAEQDLGKTLEGEFFLPVVLTDPDGVQHDTNQNTGDPLGGQILYDIVRENPDSITGERLVINKPVVTLRRSSLARVPLAGEKWLVRIPVDPSTTATLADFMIDQSRPPEGGRSIGFIRLYLMRAVQKP